VASSFPGRGFVAARPAQARPSAGIAAGTAIKGVSEQAYIAAQSRTGGAEAPAQPMPEQPASKQADWSWFTWAGLGLAVVIGILFLSGSVTVERGAEDSDFVSTYQPEGTGE
jgi:hypothetical protein